MRVLSQKMHKSILVLGLLISGIPALSSAATVSLIPTSPVENLDVADIVSFKIEIDFTAEGGTLGGGFDVSWDPASLQLESYTSTVILGDPFFGRPPDASPGLLGSWGVGDFDGLDTGLLGSLSFSLLPGAGLSSFIALGPTTGIAGPWVSAVDFITLIDPAYNQVEVTRVASVIPVPAAFWLFGTALVGVVGFSRRKGLVRG